MRSEIRRAYLAGEGSCRELAEKHGISPGTVENWCRREKWREKIAKIDGKLMASVEHSLAKHSDDIVAQRAAFMTRSIREANALLDDIQSELGNRKAGAIDDLKKLISCWDPVMNIQRKTLSLDKEEQKGGCIIDLSLLRGEPERADAIDVSATPALSAGDALPAK